MCQTGQEGGSLPFLAASLFCVPHGILRLYILGLLQESQLIAKQLPARPLP